MVDVQLCSADRTFGNNDSASRIRNHTTWHPNILNNKNIARMLINNFGFAVFSLSNSSSSSSSTKDKNNRPSPKAEVHYIQKIKAPKKNIAV